MPLRAHLEAAQAAIGKPIAELQEIPLPADVQDWWSYWNEASQGRQQAYAGANPLAWAELLAWSVVTGRNLAPIDYKAIKAIDRIYVELKALKRKQ